ncbi:MAG: FAD-binding protein [Coriobacteriales bacterium]|nr:FAD-binding protein [Coriobacteriales bacterium]
MNESKNGMNRRDFLKTGVMATAFGAAIATAPAIAFANEGDAGAAGSRFTAEELEKIGQPHPYSAVSYEPIEGTDPIPPTDIPQKWDYEADVVVVGTGGGGLNACVRCADAGLSVVAADKIEEAGGITKESSCYMTWGGTKLTGGLSAITMQPYSAEATFQQVMLSAAPTLNIPIARKWAAKVPECVDWMLEHGVEYSFTTDFGTMGTMMLSWKDSVQKEFFPRAAHFITDHMYSKGLEAGVDYHFGTQVTALVKDGDRIVGVKTINTEGIEKFYKGDKGVILTAGGFASNPAMLQKYCPTAYRVAASSKLTPSDTGEVVRMAWGAGADLTGFDTWAAFDGGIDAYDRGLGPFTHYLYSGDNQLSRQPWLSIDKTGARHIYIPFIGDNYYYQQAFAQGMDQAAAANYVWNRFGGMLQPEIQAGQIGSRQFVIFDANYEENIVKLDQHGCRKPITPDMPGVERMPEWLAPHDWRDGVQKSIDKGIIVSADTVEELADKLGISQDILRGAVDNWNAICEAGADPEYNYRPDWLIKIDEAATPLYGIPIGIQMGQTFCGVAIDDGWRALDTTGHTIPGLYCGNMTAGGTNGCFCGGHGGSFGGGYVASESLIRDALGDNAVTYPVGWEAQDGNAPYDETTANIFLQMMARQQG